MILTDSIYPDHPLEPINPALDFTRDTAYVGVQIPPVNGKTSTGRALVITSEHRAIPWDGDILMENGLLPEPSCPDLLEPRWSGESIGGFLRGAGPPGTAETFQSVRAYLQKYTGLRHPVEYDLVALWIMGTYLKPLFKCFPILFFNAPYESGKSRCLEVISQLALNGRWFGEITPAAFRRYAGSRLTFCLDELKDVGLKNDSPLIAMLLNAYNSAKAALADPGNNGWQPVIFKVTSPVAIGNTRDIKNEALKSRTIQIRPEYNPLYKNTNLPEAFDREPAQIRDGLYCWFLGNWQSVRDCYTSFSDIPELSAREMDSYKPLLAVASLAGGETVGLLTNHATAVRDEKRLAQKALDDRWDLLLFLRQELEFRGLCEDLPVVANRELADAYGKKNRLRVNYRSFLKMINELHVVSDIRDRHGSKYIVFNRSEIDRQLRLIEVKS